LLKTTLLVCNLTVLFVFHEQPFQTVDSNDCALEGYFLLQRNHHDYLAAGAFWSALGASFLAGALFAGLADSFFSTLAGAVAALGASAATAFNANTLATIKSNDFIVNLLLVKHRISLRTILTLKRSIKLTSLVKLLLY
jgi:hypothetical protein